MFEKFETLHRNHKLAYLDGFLCGVLAYHMAQQAIKDHRSDKEWKQLQKTNKQTRSMYDPKPL